MTSTRSLGLRARRYGLWAERATLWLMWLRGWEVAGTNVRIGKWEMDLLMCRGKELRLLEIKARKPGAWTSADLALSYQQRQRLQMALRSYLDRVPWPGDITFQRVSWAGWRCRFHEVERWEGLRMSR